MSLPEQPPFGEPVTAFQAKSGRILLNEITPEFVTKSASEASPPRLERFQKQFLKQFLKAHPFELSAAWFLLQHSFSPPRPLKEKSLLDLASAVEMMALSEQLHGLLSPSSSIFSPAPFAAAFLNFFSPPPQANSAAPPTFSKEKKNYLVLLGDYLIAKAVKRVSFIANPSTAAFFFSEAATNAKAQLQQSLTPSGPPVVFALPLSLAAREQYRERVKKSCFWFHFTVSFFLNFHEKSFQLAARALLQELLVFYGITKHLFLSPPPSTALSKKVQADAKERVAQCYAALREKQAFSSLETAFLRALAEAFRCALTID